ncbi:MAG: elongation factor 1-beta [Nanoarchaeota archaeon]
MGTALVKIKLMPESPDTDLDAIEKKAKKIIDKASTMPARIEKEPIAFGLVALILTFAIDESQSIDETENLLKKIPHVNSAEVIDFRRAIG